jgi:signal transduction histidine kinase
VPSWPVAELEEPTPADASPGLIAPPKGARFLAPLLTLAAMVTLLSILWLERADLVIGIKEEWDQLLYWALVILLVNLLHFELGPMQFTFDLPLLVAVGLIYSAPVASLVAFVGSVDVREFRGRIGLDRALYNRSQIALCVLLASMGYHAVAASLDSSPNAIFGTALATAIFMILNAILVSLYVASRGEDTFHRVILRLHVGRTTEFMLTYFAFGILAYALSRLYLGAGPWSVALFVVPIVVAYEAYVRAERLATLASSLGRGKKLLEMLMGRIVDERKDERLRIASGLHDDVIQSLIRINQLGYFLRREVEPGSEAASDAEELQGLTEETIQTLREVVGDLRDSPVSRGGLAGALTTLAKDLQFESRVKINLVAEPISDVSGNRQLLLYQVAKEAIVNALNHAEPTSVTVTLASNRRDLILRVEDNGRGFDPSQVDQTMHFGLDLMRERLRLGGGELRIESSPGLTQIEAKLPRSSPERGSSTPT